MGSTGLDWFHSIYQGHPFFPTGCLCFGSSAFDFQALLAGGFSLVHAFSGPLLHRFLFLSPANKSPPRDPCGHEGVFGPMFTFRSVPLGQVR